MSKSGSTVNPFLPRMVPRITVPAFLNTTSADVLVINANGPIDWNCDGSIESSVAAHIFGEPPGAPFQQLIGFDDWANLVFTGGSIGQKAGAPPPLPVQTPAQELNVTQDSILTTIHGVGVTGPGNSSLPPGGGMTLIFTVTNKGSVEDTFYYYRLFFPAMG